MSLETLGAVSDAGRPNRANEDGFGVTGAFAWVIDGATGLGDAPLLDAPSDAAWLTAALDLALREAAERAEEVEDPVMLLAEAAQRVELRFRDERSRAPVERYEIPTAAVLLARFDGERVAMADLGDCALYVRTDGTIARYGGVKSGRDLEQANARKLMAGGSGRTPEVVAFLREVRNRANTPRGYPIFAPEASCIARARRAEHVAASGEALLLTDGYEAAIDDYALYTPQTLLDAARVSIRGPLDAMRAVERDDPDCTRFPRFKPSDDATALHLAFGRR